MFEATLSICGENGLPVVCTDLSLTNILKHSSLHLNPNSKSLTSPSDLVLCWWYVQLFVGGIVCHQEFHQQLAILTVKNQEFTQTFADFLVMSIQVISSTIAPRVDGSFILQSFLTSVKELTAISCMNAILPSFSGWFCTETEESKKIIHNVLFKFFTFITQLPYNVTRLIFHPNNTERSIVLNEIARMLTSPFNDFSLNIGNVGLCHMSVVPRTKKTKREPSNKCIFCNDNVANTTCVVCKCGTSYCSIRCQHAHWGEHQHNCPTIKKIKTNPPKTSFNTLPSTTFPTSAASTTNVDTSMTSIISPEALLGLTKGNETARNERNEGGDKGGERDERDEGGEDDWGDVLKWDDVFMESSPLGRLGLDEANI